MEYNLYNIPAASNRVNRFQVLPQILTFLDVDAFRIKEALSFVTNYMNLVKNIKPLTTYSKKYFHELIYHSYL